MSALLRVRALASRNGNPSQIAELLNEILKNAKERGSMTSDEKEAFTILARYGKLKWEDDLIIEYLRDLEFDDQLFVIETVARHYPHAKRVADWVVRNLDISDLVSIKGDVLIPFLKEHSEDVVKENREALLHAAFQSDTEEGVFEALGELVEHYDNGELYSLFLTVRKRWNTPVNLAILYLQIAPRMFNHHSHTTLGFVITSLIASLAEHGVEWVRRSKFVAQAVLDAGFRALLLEHRLTDFTAVRQTYVNFAMANAGELRSERYAAIVGVAYGIAIAYGFPVPDEIKDFVEGSPVATAALLDCALQWKKHNKNEQVEQRLIESVNPEHAEHFDRYSRLRIELYEYLASKFPQNTTDE